MYNDFFNKNEIVIYKDIYDLSNQIIKFNKNDKLWRKIAKRGHKKYHKHFNSLLVARFIIDRSLGINSKYYWEK